MTDARESPAISLLPPLRIVSTVVAITWSGPPSTTVDAAERPIDQRHSSQRRRVMPTRRRRPPRASAACGCRRIAGRVVATRGELVFQGVAAPYNAATLR